MSNEEKNGEVCFKTFPAKRRTMGSEIQVGDIMKKDVISIEEEAPITEVAKLMKIHDIGSIVVAKNKKAEGMITEKDVIHQVVAKGADASKITAKGIKPQGPYSPAVLVGDWVFVSGQLGITDRPADIKEQTRKALQKQFLLCQNFLTQNA